jgi:glucosyl-dolichyl phosphate glucuronosyltransferase
MLKLSVVIATRNRLPYLVKAVNGALCQTAPAESYEVIVVDNGSTDGTSKWVLEKAVSATNLTYLFEPELGVSTARNTGWRQARGSYVALLDDDAIPQDDWVEQILRVFEDVQPHPVCIGGAVAPLYEATPPDWFSGLLLDYVTVVDHSPHAKFLTHIIHRQKLAGANMAFERRALEAIGGFSRDLGRVDENLLSGEEVLPQLRFESLGLPIYYDPAIRVQHHVAARRLTAEWLTERAYWGGVSDSLLSFHARGGTLWWGLRTLFWSTRTAALSPALLRFLANRGQGEVAGRCAASHRLGSVVGGWYAVRQCLW